MRFTFAIAMVCDTEEGCKWFGGSEFIIYDLEFHFRWYLFKVKVLGDFLEGNPKGLIRYLKFKYGSVYM